MNKRVIKKVSRESVLKYADSVITNYYQCEIKNIKYIGGGYFGYVYFAQINKAPYKLVIKACLTSGMHKAEARDLSLLRENCPVPVPRVYFTFDETDSIPMDFICMEYMQGKDVLSSFSPVKLSFVSRARKQNFANCITDAMGAWHDRTNDKFGLTGHAVYDNWFDYYKPFAAEILNTAKQSDKLFSQKTVKLMESAWNKFEWIFREPVTKPSLVHGDLNVVNIMCDNKLNVTAVIDPLESKWADREFDLFQLRNFTGDRFNLYETYKSKYPVSEMVDAKCAFYGLFNEAYCSILSDIKMTDYNLYVRWMERELDRLQQ